MRIPPLVGCLRLACPLADYFRDRHHNVVRPRQRDVIVGWKLLEIQHSHIALLERLVQFVDPAIDSMSFGCDGLTSKQTYQSFSFEVLSNPGISRSAR